MCSTVGRRQAILDVLMCRRRDTISNIASEFEVSERTIRRDIDILTTFHRTSMASIPRFGIFWKGADSSGMPSLTSW